MSSPIKKTRESRRISSRRPSEIACRYVLVANSPRLSVVGGVELFRLGVDAVHELAGIGQRAVLGPLDGVVQQPLHLDADLILGRLVEQPLGLEPAPVSLDRILATIRLEQLARNEIGRA